MYGTDPYGAYGIRRIVVLSLSGRHSWSMPRMCEATAEELEEAQATQEAILAKRASRYEEAKAARKVFAIGHILTSSNPHNLYKSQAKKRADAAGRGQKDFEAFRQRSGTMSPKSPTKLATRSREVPQH